MVRKYYNDLETDSSQKVLNALAASGTDFVLIGGWAVNRYVKQQRSKDVDVAVDPTVLQRFKDRYGIGKYGIDVFYSIVDGVYVDLFVQGISDRELTVPIGEIVKNCKRIEGVKVVDRNMLLLLKLSGYFREDRIKHDKDIVDAVSLIFYADIDMQAVKRYVDTYHIDERKGPMGMLEYLDTCEHLWEFVASSKQEYTRLGKAAKESINRVFYGR